MHIYLKNKHEFLSANIAWEQHAQHTRESCVVLHLTHVWIVCIVCVLHRVKHSETTDTRTSQRLVLKYQYICAYTVKTHIKVKKQRTGKCLLVVYTYQSLFIQSEYHYMSCNVLIVFTFRLSMFSMTILQIYADLTKAAIRKQSNRT